MKWTQTGLEKRRRRVERGIRAKARRPVAGAPAEHRGAPCAALSDVQPKPRAENIHSSLASVHQHEAYN